MRIFQQKKLTQEEDDDAEDDRWTNISNCPPHRDKWFSNREQTRSCFNWQPLWLQLAWIRECNTGKLSRFPTLYYLFPTPTIGHFPIPLHPRVATPTTIISNPLLFSFSSSPDCATLHFHHPLFHPLKWSCTCILRKIDEKRKKHKKLPSKWLPDGKHLILAPTGLRPCSTLVIFPTTPFTLINMAPWLPLYQAGRQSTCTRLFLRHSTNPTRQRPHTHQYPCQERSIPPTLNDPACSATKQPMEMLHGPIESSKRACETLMFVTAAIESTLTAKVPA